MKETRGRGNWRGLLAGLVIGVVLAGGAFVVFGPGHLQVLMGHDGHDMNMVVHTGMHNPHHGADGTGHDEANMPGLKGENASARESEELAIMFRNFETLSRTVTELPNGIRTVTKSSDETVMAALASHVSGMIGRVETKDDPKIFIQSPTLDIFFARGDKIHSEIDMTDEGIVVVQTSDDPEIVAALHKHAAEVSAMAERGMQAVHEMMMQRASN